MDVVNEADIEATEAVDDVYLKQLAVGDEMSIQHFRLSAGSVVPEHSHHHEQLGYIVSGEAVFLVDGEEIVVGPGDSYAIPSNEPHRVEIRGNEEAVGLDIFSPPRANPDWQD